MKADVHRLEHRIISNRRQGSRRAGFDEAE
jgi:hypothetical protein